MSAGRLCPSCGGNSVKVLEARKCHGYIRRRLLCLDSACADAEQVMRVKGHNQIVKGTRWTTYEYSSPKRGVVAVPRDMRIREIA